MLRITTQAHLRAYSLQQWEFDDWSHFFELFREHEEGEKGPLVVPAIFKNLESTSSKCMREDDNVEIMPAVFVLDVDECDAAGFERVLDALAGTACIVYSSHSHKIKGGPNAYRFRVVVQLDREYDPKHYFAIWEALNSLIGGVADRGCRALSHSYYLPTHPKESPEFFTEMGEGDPLPVDLLITEGEALLPKDEPQKAPATPIQVTHDDLEEIAARLHRSYSPASKRLAKSLKAVVAGKPFAAEGARDDTLFRMACVIVKDFPGLNPIQVAELFRASLESMDGEITVALVQDKLRRRVEAEALEAKAEATKARSERQSRIHASFSNGRQDPVTDAEMKVLRSHFGDYLGNSYIISKHRSHFFLRPDGSYKGPHSCEELPVAAHRDLAVFPHIETETEDQNGNMHKKSWSQLCQDYGRVFTGLVYDLSAERTYFDLPSDSLVIAPCPPVVEPVYHAEVHEWLEILGSKAVDLASAMLRFDRICAAGVFIGERSAGKTLFAVLAARALGGAPTPITDLTARFNAPLLKMPIVLADESPGEEYRRRGSLFLRSLLATTSHTIEEKYMPKATLRGGLRLIITANSMSVLETTETLSKHDMDALTDRLVYIPTGPEPRDYLQRKVGSERIQREWIDNKIGAEHFMWLRENHQIRNPGARFLVEGERGELHDNLVSGMGAAGSLVDWLLNYLADPKRDNKGNQGLLIADGYLHATSWGIHKSWGNYSETQPLSQNIIGRALKSISESLTARYRDNSQRARYYRIRTEILAAALDRHHLPEEDFFAALKGKVEE